MNFEFPKEGLTIPIELILMLALVLLAFCGKLIGFPFGTSLAFTVALGVVFYLIQMNPKQKTPRSGE
ncbi:MAG: hypothetical protein ABH878_05085 [bacterium]